MDSFLPPDCKNRILLPALLLFISVSALYGQGTTYSYFYRVYLKDKGDNYTSTFEPSQLLSEKAIERRTKAGIAVPDLRDLPVWQGYINQISAEGYTLHCTSKWMNTALFKTAYKADIDALLAFPFVKEVKVVKSPGTKSISVNKLAFSTESSDTPPFDRQVTMVNGYPLINSGFDGKNILIAVLDGGFLNADIISSIDHLRSRNGIRATRDFIYNKNFVYNSSTHGTAVLSILAGLISGELQGTAPGADYLLLKTEDIDSEFPCEEDFWAAGAEYADSSGADIITSSLGYFTFDDPSLNYKHSDLDGNTAFVTNAADIAASKGILVVNSAGNERNKDWKKIIFPSDGDSVLTSAAVDGNNLISAFSSAGPSSDGRIKPDNATLGVSIPVQVSAGSVTRGNGTSFSCPVLTGMAASLMQAAPYALSQDIIDAIHQSSDRYNFPDSLYGYGIPDMAAALNILQKKYIVVPEKESVAGPNPTKGDFEIIFREPQSELTVEIITFDGRVIYRKDYTEYAGRTIIISELQNKGQGIYFIRLKTGTGIQVHKIIRLKD
jgi:serine protease AprX